MKTILLLAGFCGLITSIPPIASAQTNAPATAEMHTNLAIIPLQRPEANARRRTDIVLQRAKTAPGDYDVIFVGDSITENWEGAGKNVWQKFYGQRKVLNFGVGGDRTEHVLWRFEQGQLAGLKPKAAVLMIGTNNGGRDNEADILEGVVAIVKQMRERLPQTKIVLMGIFPRDKAFSRLRGKLLQVNQALAKLADDKTIFYVDIGPQLIEADGSIAPGMMRDALHPGEPGYQIWADAIEPTLRNLLK